MTFAPKRWRRRSSPLSLPSFVKRPATSDVLLRAPAKLNLCLFIGPPRDDGLHEIRSLFEPISLADEIEVSESSEDRVLCPGVGGENLAARALAALRAAGWESPPLRLEIAKRIPLAGGLGGGSADAAAVLRLAEGQLEGIEEAARSLGADVPSQLRPQFSLVAGAGESVEPLPAPGEHALVLLPERQGLSTADVYAQADALGLGRERSELESIGERLRAAAGMGASPLEYADLLANDLEPAALSLRPTIGAALEALRGAGAAHAAMTGSGPTAFGLFADSASAQAAAAELGPPAIACGPGLR
jgi:4-diphosphocytidyl-2-C-methyl-D-erythritol kinase